VKTRHWLILTVIVSLSVVEFAIFQGISLTAGRLPAAGAGITAAGAPPAAPAPAFDTTPLVSPKKKYFGVALPGDPTNATAVGKFAGVAGKNPNILTIYAGFGDGFAASEVRESYRQNALTIIRWEPFTAKLKDIAAGKHDQYVTDYAKAVRTLNLPIALTFAHEMNGNWYPWGHSKATPKDFVSAWRHIHQIFARVGATNVIWAWTPNVINPVPSVKLKPYYPGDDYVDWLGIDGYFTSKGAHTYKTLFGPTMKAMRAFSTKPFLIVETGAAPGSARPSWIYDLMKRLIRDDDTIGFVYFDQNGSAKWRVDDDAKARSALRKGVSSSKIGFPVR
jgi:mannan endo-1,4-beta-mannosidase